MITNGESKGEKRRHIIGIIVDDHPGVVSKISGLFARRGFNIDTIIVGKTEQEKISHIVVSLDADDKTIAQVERQVNKLIDVLRIVDLDEKHSVVREHCLVKIVSSEKSRKAILDMCKVHKAEPLDVNHSSIIVEIVGGSSKIDKFLESAKQYGIKEFSRGGINALQRGGE